MRVGDSSSISTESWSSTLWRTPVPLEAKILPPQCSKNLKWQEQMRYIASLKKLSWDTDNYKAFTICSSSVKFCIKRFLYLGTYKCINFLMSSLTRQSFWLQYRNNRFIRKFQEESLTFPTIWATSECREHAWLSIKLPFRAPGKMLQ